MKLVEGPSLRTRLAADPPLVEGFVDAETQIQMNGVDFTLREVSRFGDEPGAIDFDNSERKTPETFPIDPDEDGWWTLASGPYWIVYNEVVNIPADMFGDGSHALELAPQRRPHRYRLVGFRVFGSERLGSGGAQPRGVASET